MLMRRKSVHTALAGAESFCNLGVFIAASKSPVKVKELRRAVGLLKGFLPLGTLSNELPQFGGAY